MNIPRIPTTNYHLLVTYVFFNNETMKPWNNEINMS